MPWVKGQSGNPNGRKKSPVILTDSLRKLLKDQATGEPRVTNAELVAQRLLALALGPDAPTSLGAIKLIYDRVDGKVPEPIQLQGHDGGSLAIPILPDYRIALAALAPGPVAHPLPSGEAEVSGNGPEVG